VTVVKQWLQKSYSEALLQTRIINYLYPVNRILVQQVLQLLSMPFTFSHPAIVLPLYGLVRRWVSLTGLVIGSIVPDFEYFIRMKTPSIYSHTMLGLLTFNLPVGLLLCFLFHNVVRNSLFSHLPYVLNCRLSNFKRFNWNKYFRKNWHIIIISILIGAFSHLFWDKFVHENGYVPKLFNFFGKEADMYDIEMTEYKTLHVLSSVFGGIIVLFAIFQLPVSDRIRRPLYFKYWVYIAVIMAAVMALRIYTGLRLVDYREVMINAISSLLIGILLTSLFLRRDYY
jgi:hypothetical protein